MAVGARRGVVKDGRMPHDFCLATRSRSERCDDGGYPTEGGCCEIQGAVNENNAMLGVESGRVAGDNRMRNWTVG